MQPTPTVSPTLNVVTARADRGDPADDLVAGHQRIEAHPPLVADGVQVGVADAAKQDVDLHIRRAGVAALEGERLERSPGLHRRTTV